MDDTFGLRLRRFRKAKKLTLQQVADTVGCTKAYVWELEMRDGQRPSAERVYALAKALGVTTENVLGHSPLYTKQEWQGLTKADVNKLTRFVIAFRSEVVDFIRAAEAKLKEKNT